MDSRWYSGGAAAVAMTGRTSEVYRLFCMARRSSSRRCHQYSEVHYVCLGWMPICSSGFLCHWFSILNHVFTMPQRPSKLVNSDPTLIRKFIQHASISPVALTIRTSWNPYSNFVRRNLFSLTAILTEATDGREAQQAVLDTMF